MITIKDFGKYRIKDKPDTNLKIYNYEKTIQKEKPIPFNLGKERNMD